MDGGSGGSQLIAGMEIDPRDVRRPERERGAAFYTVGIASKETEPETVQSTRMLYAAIAVRADSPRSCLLRPPPDLTSYIFPKNFTKFFNSSSHRTLDVCIEY